MPDTRLTCTRSVWTPGSTPMASETCDQLYAALEARYPRKVRRVLEVPPVAVQKTIDNEVDALETLRRLASSHV